MECLSPPRRPQKNVFLHKSLNWKSWGNRGNKKKIFEHPRKEEQQEERKKKWKKMKENWKEHES